MTLSTRTFPALALAIVLAACAEAEPTPTPSATDAVPTRSATPDATTTPAPTAEATPTDDDATPEGWRRITVPEQGFSIAVPEEWEELSPDVLGDSGIMEELLEANPDAAVALEKAQLAIESGQIALFAFDTDEEAAADTGFATNLNVINVGDVGGSSAEAAAEEVARAIREQIPIIGDVETDTVTLPAGDAAVLRYEWEVSDAQGTATRVTVTQYAIISAGGDGFILSLSAASDVVDAYEETFRQIAESFRET